MSLFKYRADKAGLKQPNGATPYYCNWMGGPTLALIRDCPTPFGPRTVYVQGEPDTVFSIPAAMEFRKRRVTGYITTDDGQYVFRPHTRGSVFPYAD